MHSPITSTLHGKDITAHIDPEVAAQATISLLDAFNDDPISATQEEIMVAIGTPVLDVNPDNPYRVICSTDVAYMRIDTDNLTADCEQVTCCCEIRPISGEFRIHPIGETYALVDTRTTNHLLQPWALCSRNADLTLRYEDSCADTPFTYKTAGHIYAPLPQMVEDYITDTLQRTVLDGRALVGAIVSDTPDVLPFELSLDDYLRIQHDLDTFAAYIATLRDDSEYTICWDHYGCGDGTTYVDTLFEINTAMTLPAELSAAAASTTTAKDLSHRLFGPRATKNVIRAVGAAPSLGTLACALALITDDTPPDWIAGIITAVTEYSLHTIQPQPDYDVAASLNSSLGLMQPYIAALDTRSYTRMLKPLATGKISFAEQLLDCAAGDRNNITDPYDIDSNVHCAVSTARPTSLHYNNVIHDIDMSATRTLGDYIHACGEGVRDIEDSLVNDTYAAPLSITAFLEWTHSPAGRTWQKNHDNAEKYITNILNAYVYNQLIERLDAMHIRDIDVHLRVARSKAEYITLGTTLSNCIKDYSYQPKSRTVIAIHEGNLTTKPVAALEITAHTDNQSMITQLYAKANSTYRHSDRIRTLVDVETNNLRAQLPTQ